MLIGLGSRRMAPRLFALLALLFISSVVSAQTTYSWTGNVSNLWSNQNNWTPIGVPANGDSLVFPQGPTTLSLQNDLPAGRSFERINVNGDEYLMAGNALAVRTQLQALGRNARFNLAVDFPAGRNVDVGSVPPMFGGAPLHLLQPITGTGTIIVPATAQLKLSGTSGYAGIVCPAACGLLMLDGAQVPGANVGAANLHGNGRIGTASPTSLRPGSTFELLNNIALGSGRIETAALSLANSQVRLSFDGIVAGTTHDQLSVNGSVSVSNSTLVLESETAYFPAVNSTIVLLANDGVDAIAGTFNGRAEASTFVVNGATWRLSYVGGTGNDIVITCIDAPKVWTGAIDALWSKAGNWTGGVPVSGDSIRFPVGAANKVTVNDLVAGRTIKNIEIEGAGYSLGGNGITVTGMIAADTGAILALPLNVAAATTMDLVSIGFSNVLDVSGSLTGSGTIRFGNGLVRVSGTHAFSGTLNPVCAGNCGTLILAGASIPSATLTINSGIYGSGQVGAVSSVGFKNIFIAAADFVYPGNAVSTGVLRTGSLFLSETRVWAELNGASAGSGHDQINVTGSVTLAGTVYGLMLSLGDTFAPTIGQTFRIIENDGSDPVAGTFAGQPEGAAVYADGAEFTISYVGGSGNDVTLTCTRTRKIWTGAVDANWSVASNWIGGVPASGDSPAFPGNAIRRAPVNDLPAGRSFRNLWVDRSDYVLTGNAIALTRKLDVQGSREIALPIDVSTNTVEFATNAGQNIHSGAISGSGTIMLIGQSQPFRGVHPFSGTLFVPNTSPNIGRLFLDDASFAAAATTLDGSLYGRGALGTLVSHGFIAPGVHSGSYTDNGGGRITTASVQLLSGGTFHAELDGVVAGASHDQLSVVGTVTIGTGAAFSLTQSNAYVPALGQKYLIIANDGADAISGSFTGVAEATVLNVAGYQYRASYVGGTGNDFELTSLNGKPATTTVVSSSLNPSGQGQTVNLLATVSGVGATPTGSVVFRDGATTLGTVSLSAGVAVYTTAALTVGAHAITAEYFGDASFGGGVSTAFSQTVVNRYTVTPTATTGGSIAPAAPRQVNHGSTETFTATPLAGYRFVSISGCGGTAIGMSLTTAPVTAACTVAAVFNRTPTASTSTLSLNEDAANADGSFVASDDDALTYSVVTGPSKGTLTILNATTGTYRYVPNANAFGADSFMFRVSDGVELSTAATVSVTIAAINDQPSLTLAALSAHAAGTTGLQQVAGFASFDAGPANEEATQSALAYDVLSVTDTAGVVQNGSVAIANSGQLSYTLTGVGGTATVSVRVRDNGGTALGGIDTSTSKSFDIVVAPGADLQIAKTNHRGNLVDGQSTVYAIVVANAGPNAANGAQVVDSLPTTLVNGSFACNAANSSVPCPGACTGTGNLACTINLPVNAFVRIDVMATVLGALGVSVRNEASIAPPTGTTALNTANDVAVDQDVIVPDGLFMDGFGPTAGSSLTVPGAEQALDAP